MSETFDSASVREAATARNARRLPTGHGLETPVRRPICGGRWNTTAGQSRTAGQISVSDTLRSESPGTLKLVLFCKHWNKRIPPSLVTSKAHKGKNAV